MVNDDKIKFQRDQDNTYDIDYIKTAVKVKDISQLIYSILKWHKY